MFRFRAAPAPQKCSPVTVWVSPMTPHPHGVQHQLLEENEMAKEEIFDKLKEPVHSHRFLFVFLIIFRFKLPEEHQ